jgi:predicted adenylyl cyclase CyaB
VDKKREIYKYKDYEIVIDKIKGLGDYVEIEYKGKTSSKAKAKLITSQMVQFLKDIGVGKIKRNYAGYPYQILFPKEIKIDEL